MRATTTVALAVLLAFAVVAVAAPVVVAAPPDIGDGCDYFHWHNGNVAAGQLPGYHCHPCL